MKIAVCIKAVPDPQKSSGIEFDPVTKNVKREKLELVINPTDLHAIELAMQLKERFGGTVTAFTMGAPNVEPQVRSALSYGIDEAYILSDRAFGGADSLATSYTLACGIKKTGPYDLVISGNESSDGGTTNVPSQLGEWLGLPHIMEVVGFEYDGNDSITVRKKMDDDFADFTMTIPGMIAVSKSINKVRYPNIKGIMMAKKKPIVILSADVFEDMDRSLIGQSGSPTRNGEMSEVSFARNAEEITGTPEEVARKLLAKIRPLVSSF